MQYEVMLDQNQPEDWRVEAIDHEGEGEVYVAVFTGPDAERRAREYADWRSTTERQVAASAARS